MRRLVSNQAVLIDLDAPVDTDPVSIPCRVESVQGPVATLVMQDRLPAAVVERLATGSMCFMSFSHVSAPVALRGIALVREGSDRLEFVVVDGIQVTERRGAERVALVTAVRATPVGADGSLADPVATVTSNLSVGGALLLRRPKLGFGPRWKIELLLPGGSEQIHCEAVLARETETHLGVRLVGMQEADQLRLASLVASIQRRPRPTVAARPPTPVAA